jgi:type IV pilus assembly protein PilC
MKSQVFSSKQLVQISRDLYYLLKLSAPLPEAVNLLSKNTSDPQLARLFQKVSEELSKGKSLSEGLKPFSPPLFFHLISFGEKNGFLPEALQEAGRHYEADALLKRKMKAILSYPLALFIGSLLMVGVFLLLLWPHVGSYFLSLEHLPSWLRLFYLVLSQLSNPVLFLFVLIVLWLFLFWSYQQKKWLQTFLFFFPLIRKTYIKACFSRFLRGLALLLSFNYPLPKAFEEAIALVDYPPLSKAIFKAKKKISQGGTLAEALASIPLLDIGSLFQNTQGPEFSQEPAKALCFAAELLEVEVSSIHQMLLAFLEPACLFAVGFMVLAATWLFWFPFYSTVAHILP